MFNCLRDPVPSTSAGEGTRSPRPGRSAWGPAFTGTDVTHYDWLYVGKCTDAVCVYFAGESKYDNISAKEEIEAGVCRIPFIYNTIYFAVTVTVI